MIENHDSDKDKEGRRYIHLVDGGITDNHGIRNHNEEERWLFNNIATSLSLPDDEVDRLIESVHRLLEASPEFQELVATLRRDTQ